MNPSSVQTEFFVAGGTLNPNVPSYVKRPADDELLGLTVAGEFCYILTPRQMGKSSLMVRTATRLQAQGVHTAIVDLTEIGTVAIDEFYLGILTELQRRLNLSINPETWWQQQAALGQPQRFGYFVQDVILRETDGRIVIFIDEIDSTLNLEFRDDFFAAIRALYNGRTRTPELGRISFVLLGAASPSDLINNQERTPFNIGHEIALQEFSTIDARILRQGLTQIFRRQGSNIFKRIFHWTNGHPYLTQKLCLEVVKSPANDWSDDAIDHRIEQLFLSEEAQGESNIRFVRDLILNSSCKLEALAIYEQVYKGQEITLNKQSLAHSLLILSGLVRVENKYLNVRNEIYRQVFNRQWIQEHLPRINVQQWRKFMTTAGILLVIFVVISALLILWYIRFQQQQTNEAIAQQFTTCFLAGANNKEQLGCLSGLFQLEGFESEARSLFFSRNTTVQTTLFLVPEDQEIAEWVRIVVVGTYYKLENTPANNDVLMAMKNGLELSSGHSTLLSDEIAFLLNGRHFYNNGDNVNSIKQYSLGLNSNQNNPALYYDRAIAYISGENFIEALDDLQALHNLKLAEDIGNYWLARLQIALNNSNPLFIRTAWENGDVYKELIAYVAAPGPPTIAPTHTALPPTQTLIPTITSTPLPVQPPAIAELGDTLSRPIDDMIIRYVPGGRFMMGSTEDDLDNAILQCVKDVSGFNCDDDYYDDELPQHPVTVSSFWLDQTEVSNAQFSHFLNIFGNQTEGGDNWLHLDSDFVLIEEVNGQFQSKAGLADHPVMAVSWYGANAYCQWVGGQLPTEAQWEYAARGENNLIYPWGNEFSGNRANYCDSSCFYNWSDVNIDDGFLQTSPVGNYPSGLSWVETADMAGNAWEWVNDWYGLYALSEQTDPPGPAIGTHKIMRGGSWTTNFTFLRTTMRRSSPPAKINVQNVGFRCAMQPGS